MFIQDEILKNFSIFQENSLHLHLNLWFKEQFNCFVITERWYESMKLCFHMGHLIITYFLNTPLNLIGLGCSFA
jgi:hypothetical protein